MFRAEDGLLGILADAASNVGCLDPTDKDSVIHAGVALEGALGELPDDAPEAAGRALMLCLQGLQDIYSDTGDPKALSKAIVAVVEAASKLLAGKSRGDSVLIKAEKALTGVLGQTRSTGDDEDEEPAASDSEADDEPAVSPDLSLNEAATLLVQIEPDDLDELAELARSLRVIASGEPVVSSHVIEAASKLEQMPDADPALAEELFHEAGKLIERAINVQDGWTDEEQEPGTAAVEPTVSSTASEQSPGVLVLPSDADPELIGEFITECREYISGAEAALLALETDSDDIESVNTVFRAFHTIKGTSAFMGLTSVSELAHKAESLLSRVRDKEISCTGGYADLALRSIDTLKELIQAVQDALGGDAVSLPDGLCELMELLSDPESHGVSADAGISGGVPRLGDILVAQGGTERDDVEVAAEGEGPLGTTLVRAEAASVSDVAKTLRTQKKIAGGDAVESSVRVRTDRLDRLIDMVGELVIAQSMVAQDDKVVMGEHHDLCRKVTHLGKIVRELQYLSMSMRMVPLKATFQKMNRLVRDVAKKSGKLVDFISEGDDTEIDRNMVDIIGDPLVHMIRNAVDHGVELPDVRESSGKSRTGTVTLRAYHSGGNVVVEMSDDGKGLDRSKIVEKAIQRGLIDSDKGMSDSEVLNLIFEPGFSTADKVTDISGRGVGMDVVKRSVEALMGRVDITSETGKGSTFSIRLPLTLAVTDGMLVKVGPERFIIPTTSIHISFRPEGSAISTVNGRGELVMLRGELMPICRLHRLFGIRGAVEEPTHGLLVVVGDGDRQCAILVDELLGQQHVVAKSLGDGIGKVQGISGGAILGDGRVGLILDTAEIEALARQVPSSDAGLRLAA